MKMTVNKEITLKMAKAAQLRIAEDEVDRMTDSINDILDFCALVGDLDTTGTPDFTWRMKKLPERRADSPAVWSDRDRFLADAPTSEGDFFKVPKIVAEG